MIKDNLESEAIGFFTELGKKKGMDSLSSKIFAVLIMEPEEIAMEELAKKTGYSLASISNKISMFESLGIHLKRSKPGTKKIYLYFEKEHMQMLKNVLLQIAERVRETEAGVSSLLSRHKAKTNKEKKQHELLENTLAYAKKIRPIIERSIEDIKRIK